MSNKPTGVIASGVVALLGALLMLLICVLEGAAFLVAPGRGPMTPQVRLGLYLGLAMFGTLGIWGTVTAIGLFRFRNWARISTIVFSVLLGLAGLAAAPLMLLVPAPATAPQSFAAIRVMIVVFYAALGLLGVFWLYYFSRRTTREAFGEMPGAESGGRPLSISIIGWWLLLSGILAVLMAPFHPPGSILIWILTGWAAAIWYAAYGALFAYTGYGLLRLKPLARAIAIFTLCYGAVNGLVFFLLPGADARLAAMVSHYSFASQTPPYVQLTRLMYAAIALISMGIPLWFLITRKSAFQPAGGPFTSQSE